MRKALGLSAGAAANRRIPESTIIPHTSTNTPPSTERGIATNKAPNLGQRPYSIRMTAAICTTNRLATRVVAMIPMFWV